jgi:hypothetical protein
MIADDGKMRETDVADTTELWNNGILLLFLEFSKIQN